MWYRRITEIQEVDQPASQSARTVTTSEGAASQSAMTSPQRGRKAQDIGPILSQFKRVRLVTKRIKIRSPLITRVVNKVTECPTGISPVGTAGFNAGDTQLETLADGSSRPPTSGKKLDGNAARDEHCVSSPASRSVPSHMDQRTGSQGLRGEAIETDRWSIDHASANISISSDIINFPHENGRRYHAYKSGRYHFPNDDVESEREDMLHSMVVDLICGKKLHFAPLENPSGTIIDVGTGTGMWAIESRFPFTLLGSEGLV